MHTTAYWPEPARQLSDKSRILFREVKASSPRARGRRATTRAVVVVEQSHALALRTQALAHTHTHTSKQKSHGKRGRKRNTKQTNTRPLVCTIALD